METQFYSSLNWALTTDPMESIFSGPWEAPSPRRPRLDQEQADNGMWTDPQLDLDLLLSASSYPIPDFQFEDPLPQGERESEQNSSDSCFLSNALVAQDEAETQFSEGASAVPSNPAKRRISKPSEPAKKRGRPRKLIENGTVNPEERRRTQVRMAQRAYRSRKEANVSQLKDRIAQLECAVKQMSTSVIHFGDDIVRSGALDSYPELLKPLGNTVQACLALPVLPFPESELDFSLNDTTGLKPGQRKQITPMPYTGSSTPQTPITMDVLEFIDRLHITCIYQAYLVCANPSVPLRRLERPFRMLLSLMPRAFVAEYFKDWLLAKAGHKSLEHWDHIPFVRVGGAGTHYPTTGNVYHPFLTKSNQPLIEEDASRFASIDEVGDEIEEVWFDMGDLQGYLRERELVFHVSEPLPAMNFLGYCQKEQGSNGVARLMQRLVRCAICLGRSPGFRRRDVKAAVDEFVMSQGGLPHELDFL